MRTLTLIFVCSLAAFGQSGYVRKTVCAAGCDYTGVGVGAQGLQQAITDAQVYQDGTACVPYIIEIQAGYTINAPLTGGTVYTLPSKACAYDVTLRSSRVGEIMQRFDPTMHAGMYATIKAAQTQTYEVLAIAGNSSVGHWRIEGIEFTTTPPNGEMGYILGFGSYSANAYSYNITVDKCWVHGGTLELGPFNGIGLIGHHNTVQNSRIEQVQDSVKGLGGSGEGHGMLVQDCVSCNLINNYVEGSTENVMAFYGNSILKDEGNYYHKRPIYKWSTSDGTNTPPSGACYSDATSGEYYLNSAEAAPWGLGRPNFDGAHPIASVSNSAGHYQVVVSGIDYPDQTLAFITPPIGAPGITGTLWTLDRTAVSTYTLHGSTFYSDMNTAYGGYITKVYGAYVCSGGVWATTTEGRVEYIVKNLHESKGHHFWKHYGNVFSSSWVNSQSSSLFFNIEGEGNGLKNTYIYANKLFDIATGMGFGQVALPTRNLQYHDNLAIIGRLGQTYQDYKVMAGCHITVNSFLGATSFWDFSIYHNTQVLDDRAPVGDTCSKGFTGYPTIFQGTFRYDNNITGGGSTPIYDDSGNTREAVAWGLLTGQATTVYNKKLALLEFGDVSNTPCWMLPAFYLAAPYDCQSDPASIFTAYASDGTGDYHVKPAYTFGYHAATDRPGDIGADIDWINAATACAVTGCINPYLTGSLKYILPIGMTTAQVYYTCPDTGTCTVSASTDPLFGSLVFSQTDGGGNPARSMGIYGLTRNTTYSVRVVAASYPLAPLPDATGERFPRFTTQP